MPRREAGQSGPVSVSGYMSYDFERHDDAYVRPKVKMRLGRRLSPETRAKISLARRRYAGTLELELATAVHKRLGEYMDEHTTVMIEGAPSEILPPVEIISAIIAEAQIAKKKRQGKLR